MSKIDQKYIDNLQKFTDALEGIVEQMKTQQKEGTSDVVNEMLKNIPDKLTIIVDNQKDILKNQKAIKKDTSEILSEIKKIKNKESTGGLSTITDTNNKTKIVDAVKSIILIAGGILAIGMAFKIVGKVDFASVVALSIGILVAVQAFKKISEMDMKVTKMGSTVFMMILIAGALLGSAWILSKMPVIDKTKSITLLLVAGSLGLATWLILKAIKGIDIKKDWTTILLLPILIPIIAASIWLSSIILSNVAEIGWKQALSIAITGVAIGIAAFAVGLAMKGMKGVSWKEILAIPVVIPLVALGITLSSLIFKRFQSIKDPVGLLKGSLAIGIAVLIFTPSLVLIGKFIKGNFAAIVAGTLGIAGIALAIVATAWLFKVLPPDPMRYPDWKWGLNVGLGMLAFIPSLLVLGLIAATGVGAIVLLAGAAAILGLAGVMVGVALILNKGKFDTYPSFAWAMGVGTSMVLFSAASIIAIPGMVASGIIQFLGGEDPLTKLAKTMVAVGEILTGGSTYWKEGNYPSGDWSSGVGGSLFMFARAFATIMAIKGLSMLFGKSIDFNEFVKKAAQSMVLASSILSIGYEGYIPSWNTGYPTKDWADGVGGSLMAFANAFSTINNIENGGLFRSGSKIDFNSFVKIAAQSMVQASDILSKGYGDYVPNWSSGYPTKDWADGVGGSLMMFAKAFSNVSDAERGGWFQKDRDFSTFITKASQSMVLASYILSKGIKINGEEYVPNWNTGYPTKDWATGVGGALITFAKAFKDVSDAESGGWFKKDKDFSVFITKAATAITTAAIILSLVKSWSSYPTPEWVIGVTSSLFEIAKIVSEVDLDMDDMIDFNYFLQNILPHFSKLASFPNIDPFTENINKFTEVINNLPEDKYKAINNLTDSIKDFSSALKDIDMSTLDKLSTISQGVLLVSIIDEAKLRETLDAISEKKAELKEIYGDEKESLFTKFTNLVTKGRFSEEETKEKSETIVVNEKDLDKEAFYNNTEKMLNEMTGIKEEIQNLALLIKSNVQFNK